MMVLSMGDLGFAQTVRQEIGLDRSRATGAKSVGSVGQADEDVAADAFAGDRLQAELGLVEILAHLAGKQQRAVEIIGPLVIGADELGRTRPCLAADARAAMAAGIVQARILPSWPRTMTTG